MTFNVEDTLEGEAVTLKAVGQPSADVICLEKVTPKWETALRRRYSGRFPQMLFRTQPWGGGLGILSKYPLEEKELIPSPAG